VIPYALALLAYLPFAALLMLDRNGARGFSIAMVLGQLLLPAAMLSGSAGTVNLPIIPDLEKVNVPAIGALIGTLIFHPDAINRYRFSYLDAIIAATFPLLFMSSYANGHGAYDGVSQCITAGMNFVLPLFLARIHLGSPGALKTYLIVFGIGAACYAPFALWEFRFSPQLHTNLYGYFQHVFIQHMRGGLFRPILAFSHGLALARFFAFAAFLLLFPLRKELEARYGQVGRHLYLAPLAGLVVSMSVGPYMLFILLCAGWYIARRHDYVYYLLPAAGFLWLGTVFLDVNILEAPVQQVASVNPDRAQSLEYRLEALSEYKSVVMARPWFGHGGWGAGRSGRATDSQALIEFLQRGFPGGGLYFLWWACAMHTAFAVARRAAGSPLGAVAMCYGVLASLSLLISTIDSALDHHLLIGLGALIGIKSWLTEEAPRLQRAARIHRHAPPLRALRAQSTE